jgi:hypothetical protein
MLTVSASQIATAHMCVRKWWLERVRRLTVEEKDGRFTFGSVFHSCCERYLLADDLGRDRKTGEPVDLFPEGWKDEVSRYTGEVTGTVTDEEAGIIKSLVTAGIQEGVLYPYPERRVEREISYTLGKVETIDGKKPVTVMFKGYIDCESRNMIVDHKTSKSPRYFLSKNKIVEDMQLLIYGKILADDLKERGTPATEIILRHNQFCKDPDDLRVRSTEGVVTVRFLEHHWNTVVMPTIKKMVRYRDQALVWSDMPEPESGHIACNKYGGCGYMPICGGRITESIMQQRLDKQSVPVTLTQSVTQTPDRKDNDMSLAEKLAAKSKMRSAASSGDTKPETKAETKTETKPKVEPDTKPAAKPDTKATEVPEGMTPPPWANASCSACEGNGFNTKGGPCKVCDLKAAEADKSRHFEIEPQEDGSFVWVNKDDSDFAGISPGRSYGREEPKAESRVNTEVKDKEEAQAENTAEAKPKPKTETRGRKKKEEKQAEAKAEEPTELVTGNFRLYINCRPTKTGKGLAKTVDLHELLEEARVQIAEANQVDSFYDLDPFKRRDIVATLAPQIAHHAGKNAVIACGVSTGASELRVLIDALKPLARQVVVGDSN